MTQPIRLRTALSATTILAAGLMLAAAPAQAQSLPGVGPLPDTGNVTSVTGGLSGGAPGSTSPTFTTTGAPGGPQTLQVDLKDNRTILNWGGAWGGSGNGFDIAAGNTVNFKDARAASGVSGRTDNIAVLNRDLSGSGASNISGTLRSDPNVSVYVINARGFVFGGSSVVDTGSFFASTADVTDADFFDDNGSFSLSGPNIVGRISVADGASFRTAPVSGASGDRIGDLVLVAQEISLGASTLQAGGDVALVHARAVTLRNAPGSPLSFVIEAAGNPNFRSSASISGRNVSIALSYYQAGSLLLDATGSIEATGASVTDRGVVLSVGQAATGVDYAPGVASNGRIISTNLNITSAKNIDARADGIILGDLTAAGSINIHSGALIGNYAASVRDLAADTISISGRFINARNLTTRSGPVTFSGENVSIEQGLNIAGNLMFAGGNFYVGGASAISGSLDLDLTGSAQFGNIQADKIDIDVGGSIRAGNVQGLHGVRLVTPFLGNGLGGQLRVGTVSAAANDGDVILQGDLVFSVTDPGTSPPTPRDRITITAGRDLTIKSGDSLLLANAVAGRNLSVSAGHIDALRLEATAGSAQIASLGTLNNRSNKGVATIDTLKAGTSASVEGTTVTLRSGAVDNTLGITGDSVLIGSTTALSDLSTGGTLNIFSRAAAILRGNVTSGGDIAVTGTTVTVGNPSLPGAQIRAKGAINLTATTSGIQGTGNALLQSNSDGVGDEAITLTAATGVNFLAGTTLLGGTDRQSDVRIRSAMNSSVAVANLSARSLQSATGADPFANGIVRNAAIGFLGQASLRDSLTAQGTAIAVNGPITVTAGNIDLRAANPTAINAALNASGTISVVTSAGNLTIGAAGSFAGSEVVLSTPGAFINNGGANVMSGAGRWLVYSADPAGNTFGGLDSGTTAIWNGTLATRPPSSITGNRYVFALQPMLTFATVDFSKVYGTDLTGSAAIPFAVSGYHPGVAGAFLGDTAATTYSGNPLIQSAGFAERTSVAGGPYAQTLAQGTVQSISGYALAFAPSTGLVTVMPRALTGTAAADNKIYDGTLAGTGTVSIDGVLAGDTVGATGVFTFADKHAGTGKTVNVSTTLTGADSGNYTLAIPATVLADILQKALTATVTANGKTYDGTTAGTGTVSLDGLVAGDNVGTSGITFTFADKNAGTGKSVTVGGSLSGADAGNYTVSLPATALADILKKALTASATVDNKTYDGTTVATGALTLSGVVTGDAVGTSGTSFGFTDKEAGTGKTVNITGTTLTGADSGNYTLTVPATALADILKKALTASVTANGKIYDGTTAATGTVSLTGVLAGDDVGTGGITLTFADKNAGTGKTVVVGGTLSGADAGNYTVSLPATVLADILKRAITASAVANSKTYDGTTAATGTLTLNGVVAGDTVATSGTSFTFADKSAGTGKTVNITGTTLTGADSGNYTLTVPAIALADILKKALTATVTADSKTYDGTTAATGTVALNGVVSGDAVSTGGVTFTFADKKAGAGKTVVVGGGVAGADAGNYTVALPATVLADILKKALTATVTVNGKTYDGTTATTGTVSLSGVVSGDTVGTTGTSFTFADRNAGTGKTVNITGTTMTGADSGNYTLTIPASALADIAKRALNITADDKAKYTGEADPALTYLLTLGSLVAGDQLTGALARAPGETPGNYAINQGELSAGGNYTITFTPGTLTISVNPATSQQQTLRAISLPAGIQAPPAADSGVKVGTDALCGEDTNCVVN